MKDLLPALKFNPYMTNLKQLVNFIQGDMLHCMVCSSKFEEPHNMPRVLFCGDSLCEKCLRQSIQPKALNDCKARGSGKATQEAAGQLTCLVCNQVHIFKMTRNGFIVCNDKYVKVRDEQGLVNLLGPKIKYNQDDLRRAIEQNQMMDNSINIPADLIIRSLPLNVELIDHIREHKSQEVQRQPMTQHIGKFIHLDKLDENEANYYMKELSRICDEDISHSSSYHPLARNYEESIQLEHFEQALLLN